MIYVVFRRPHPASAMVNSCPDHYMIMTPSKQQLGLWRVVFAMVYGLIWLVERPFGGRLCPGALWTRAACTPRRL